MGRPPNIVPTVSIHLRLPADLVEVLRARLPPGRGPLQRYFERLVTMDLARDAKPVLKSGHGKA